MSTLRWLLINIGLLVCMYFGFFESVQGCKNIALFYIWGVSILSLVFFSEEIRKVVFKPLLERNWKFSLWKTTLDRLFDFVVLGVLIYFGHVITGIFWLIQILANYVLIGEYKKEMAKCQAEQ